jgi:putative aldouronate transport system substrate-binding protein
MGGLKKKKLWGSVSLVLALSLALAGCSGDNEKATTKDGKEVLNISAFIGTPNQAPAKDNRIYKKIQDELGVNLEMEFLVGDLQQKLGVMIAGGDFPDLSQRVRLFRSKISLKSMHLI